MLVSHRAKFIYLKTFKTAGTSVEMALEPACRPEGAPNDGSYYNGPAGIVAERGGRAEGNPYRSHADARVVRRQVGPDLWARYTKIAAVRNPYDKAVSMFWHQNSREAMVGDPADPEAAIAAFRAWIAGAPKLPRDHLRVAIDGEVFLDAVVRYERLEDDLARLGKRLGIAIPSLHRFHGDMRLLDLGYQAYYDTETATRVAAHYALDFKAFGYDLEGWQGATAPNTRRSAA